MDGATDCATPAIRDVTLWFRGGIDGNQYTVDYVTNLGRTGSITLDNSSGATLLPKQSASEWVTSIRVRATLNGGESSAMQISGQVPRDLPEDSSDAVYRYPKVPKGSPVYLENCLSGAVTNSVTSAVVQQVRDVCGYAQIQPDRPSVRVLKQMTDTVQGPGGEMGVTFDLMTTAGKAKWSPVLTDLLPADLRFVPGSFTTTGLSTPAKSVLPDSLLKLEVVDDYQGTGRQLVRVSWPGTEGLAPDGHYGNVKFKVRVQTGAPVAERTNQLSAFDSKFSAIGCTGNPGKVDTDGLVDGTRRAGCSSDATYTVVSTPAVGGTKWVRGSQDADFKAAPGVGSVLPGKAATYRLDVANLGNVALSKVVAYEILPYVGDKGVGPAGDGARGSEWQTLLSGAVKTDVPAGIMYSKSTNPCRGEVMKSGGTRASAPAGCVDDWSATLPGNPADVRAIRIDFGDRTFAPGEVQPVTIPATTPADAEGLAWNSFAVAAVDESNGKAILPVEPNRVGLRTSPSLAIDKSASTAKVTRGGEITWTITVTNDGTGLADGVIVVDEIQEGMEIVSSDSDNGTYDPATSTWKLKSGIPVGQKAVLTLVTRVLPDTDVQKVCNVATVSVTGTENSAESPKICADVVVPHLDVKKVVDQSAAAPGDAVKYTVTVKNDGTGDYTAADPAKVVDDLTDVLDDASFDGTATATSGSVSYAKPKLTWQGPLAVGEEASFTYTVKVGDAGDSSMKNSACSVGKAGDDECAETETPLPRVLFEKSSDPESGVAVRQDGEVTYTLKYTNTGKAPGVVDSTDDLTSVLDDAELVGDPVSSAADVSTTVAGNKLRVVGPIKAGETVTVKYTVKVKADGSRGDNLLKNQLVPDCHEDYCPVPPKVVVHPVEALEVSKSVDPASGSSVRAGDALTYTLTFKNSGQAPTKVDHFDDLSKVLDDAEVVSPPQASSDALVVSGVDSGQYTVKGSLQTPGETVTVKYTVKVKADGSRGDDVLGNFLVPTGTDVPKDFKPGSTLCTENYVSDIAVTKSSDPQDGTKVTDAQKIVYTLTFKNRSQSSKPVGAEVDYTDHLKDVLDDARLIGGPASSNSTVTAVLDDKGQSLRVTGSLKPGETALVTYEVQVKKWADQKNHSLRNVVAVAGEKPICAPGSELCTEHPTTDPKDPTPGPKDPTPGPQDPTPSTGPKDPLPSTGAPVQGALIAALLLGLVGTGLLILRRRRHG